MKKLSLAIYWHMHQPVYEIEGTYLMPWSRLHAVKDYLDMILFLERFPNLKLNFDIVPALIDTIEDYSNGMHDIHSELTITDTKNMTNEEKSFIINNFFSSKFETMIFKSAHYKELYLKRYSKDICSPFDFTEQELSDLMALFNLVWIDPIHYQRYPRLQELWEKQYDYTLDDRIEIIDIQRQIIKEIVPTYKKYLAEGRIEFTTSAYYHPILPILANTKTAIKNTETIEGLPQSLDMAEDARVQIKDALDRVEEVIGVRPKGFWPPELAIESKTLALLAKEGIEWAISDEGILSDSLNINFVRDFNGNLNDPYHILKVYEYRTKTNPIKLIFRDRSIPNLINFGYTEANPELAGHDLYNKIKIIQNKLLVSPDKSHLLTIALDGENCWENYQNDGNDFLAAIYSLLENDESLETVLISDYIKKDKNIKPLNKVSAGSSIDKTFQFWIGENTKNKAWAYLANARNVYEEFAKENKNHPNLQAAYNEILISQGSDWFWWYGEPNNSGQDFVFDYMFREHLKKVYTLLELEPPEELNSSLITKVEVPLKYPARSISPKMDGLIASYPDWYYAGNISLLDGPVYRDDKLVDNILFGCDENNIYFRLHLNKNSLERGPIDYINQFYIYIRNASNIKNRAHLRVINKTGNPYPILYEKFDHEIAVTLIKDTLYPIRLSKCTNPNIWTIQSAEGINVSYKDVIDLSIPFDILEIDHKETLELFLANTEMGVKNSHIPHEILLPITRD